MISRNLSVEEWHALGTELLDQIQTPEMALDPALFTQEQLDPHSWIYLGAFLSSWQSPRPLRMTGEGLELFLVKRYRLGDIDVAHPDLFKWNFA